MITNEIEKEIEYKILKIISCGKPFSSWICGDFLEHEVDEEGRSLGKCYFCDECHKKAEEILNVLGSLSKEKEMLDKISKYNEERYGHTKDSCESQEYDALKEMIDEWSMICEFDTQAEVTRFLSYVEELKQKLKGEIKNESI